MKNWFRKQMTKMKAWVIALLITLGVIVGPLVYSETISFTYVRATQFDDGSPMPETDIQFTRLYCDGSLAAEEPGADQSIDGDLSIGSHDCYGTHVDIYDRESLPSNTVTRIVDPPGTGPGSPVLDP